VTECTVASPLERRVVCVYEVWESGMRWDGHVTRTRKLRPELYLTDHVELRH